MPVGASPCAVCSASVAVCVAAPKVPSGVSGVCVGAVTFSGDFSAHRNADAAEWLLRDIWPRLREQIPGVKLVLAGRNPSATSRR